MSRLALNRFSIFKEVKLFSSHCYYSKQTGKLGDEDVKNEPKKSKVPVKKIFLINHDKTSLGSVTMEEANALAKRRNLQLRKIESSDSVRHKLESYQLFTNEQVRGGKSESKEVKDMTISAKIAEFDFNTKLKSTEKWMAKGFIVNVVINHIESTTQAEKMLSAFEKCALDKNYKVVQKQVVTGGKLLKFLLQADKKKIAAQNPNELKIDEKPNT